MSYAHMDHVRWVESNIAAFKRRKPTKADERRAKEFRGWYAAPDVLNPFQRRAVTILGIVGGGIYNAPVAWDTAYWDKRCVIVPWWKSLATFDFMDLTRFTLLCHEGRIRGEISPKTFRHLEIALHERTDEGGMAQRHPNIEECIAAFREEIGDDHPVKFGCQHIPHDQQPSSTKENDHA